jgi:hypothetical protein
MAIEIREVPSSEDRGDWFIFAHGEQLPESYWSPEQARAASRAVAAALRIERERCVKIALAHGWDEAFGEDAAHNIADAIRQPK